MDTRVAKRYARALFAAALEENNLGGVEDDINGIAAALLAKPDFRQFLFSPVTAADEKLQMVERVFSDRVTALTMSLLRLLLDKRRIEEFEFIRQEFIAMRRRHDRIVYAVFTSARPLDDEARTSLVAKLERSLGKRVEAEYEIEPRLLGGVKVQYDNFVLDGTVRGSLDRMRDDLVRDLLKQA
ncbi:MAG TPA: ATP synthase F1 subunit delta [Fimbriimonadaceae bacterium]|nr:ATP synthase F1 subunit delta [Fimbriimonadaceae bacterium]HRJ96898.1 ATP synthase F1 subunit delta [Fimbriimonadaceae bacterium]